MTIGSERHGRVLCINDIARSPFLGAALLSGSIRTVFVIGAARLEKPTASI
ncbi:hypothetical protein [Paraburkholderia sediminicola]|uniref:hypothetical protein n=1 Tax=Paraburkholderia sediminicola TaxID=458836 RepID=UPI001582EF05|nr:hypothetical protein [Paraburkholderia sediminicola]